MISINNQQQLTFNFENLGDSLYIFYRRVFNSLTDLFIYIGTQKVSYSYLIKKNRL